MPPNFSPSTRRLARRRRRFTSKRGGIIIALLLAVSIGGGLLYWRWQLHEALVANTPAATLAEECEDLEDTGDLESGDPSLAAQKQACEDQALTEGEE